MKKTRSKKSRDTVPLKGDLENSRKFVRSKMIKAATCLLLKVVDLLNLTVAAVTSCQLTESQVNDRLLRFRQGLNLSREK